MGIVIALVVIALVAVAFTGWMMFAGAAWIESSQKRAEANAESILDETFDGRDDVTFNVHMRSLKFDTVVRGAKERGYKLTHQAGDPAGAMTLMFERAAHTAEA